MLSSCACRLSWAWKVTRLVSEYPSGRQQMSALGCARMLRRHSYKGRSRSLLDRLDVLAIARYLSTPSTSCGSFCCATSLWVTVTSTSPLSKHSMGSLVEDNQASSKRCDSRTPCESKQRSPLGQIIDKARRKACGEERLAGDEGEFARMKAKEIEKQKRREEYERLDLGERTKLGTKVGFLS